MTGLLRSVSTFVDEMVGLCSAGDHFGVFGFPGQYFDFVSIHRWASSLVGKSPM
jgi:hypothetical protein